MANTPILFYTLRNKWGIFSNFFKGKFELDGVEWPTVEHYFQAQKFPNTEHVENIRRLATPKAAKDYGRRTDIQIRPDWEEVKEDVMYLALDAKFSQRPTLKARLLETGNRVLVEHSKFDTYWGDGGDGSGRNRLGILLMALRDELRADEQG